MKISVIFDSLEEAQAFGINIATPEDNSGKVAETESKPKAKAKPKTKPKAKPKAKPKKEEVQDEEEGITLDDLRTVFQGLVKDGKRPEALALLKKYGVGKIHEVEEEDMEGLYNDALKLAEGEETEEEEEENDPLDI